MKIRGFAHRRAWRLCAAVILLFAAISMSLRGQDKDSAVSLIGKFFCEERAKEILKAVEILDELKRLAGDQLQIKIGGALSENLVPGSLLNLEREPKELSRLNLNSSISKGFYPNEVTFITDSNFQLEDGAIKENVTKLLLNYEYFLLHWLEGYVFVERFSDSYLSIQQRYEVGTGVKLEAEIPFLFQKECGEARFRQYGQTLRLAIEDLIEREKRYYQPKLLEGMKQALGVMKENLNDLDLIKTIDDIIKGTPVQESDLDLKLMDLIVKLRRANAKDDRGDIVQKWLDEKTLTLAELREGRAFLKEKESVLSSSKAKEAMVSWRKKNAFLGLGLAFSLFSEIEKAEIKEEIINDVWETISFPASHRLRWVLRPSFELRPIKSIGLKGQFYFKSILWEPNGKNKRSNTRQDHYLKLDYELPASVAWAKALTFFIAYEYHYDSIPPRIPSDTLEELATRYGIGAESINPSADNKHYVLNLGVEIKF